MIPFWTYKEIARNRLETRFLIKEVFLNVIMMIPVGLLLPYACNNKEKKNVLIVGVLISAIIETIQGVTNRGLFELDDIFHNTLGVIIGFGVYRLLDNGFRRICDIIRAK